jgi:hypothetical protein
MTENKKYVNLVKIVDNTVSCEEHGAMLCVNREKTLYRCPACGVGLSIEFTGILVLVGGLKA